MSVWPDSEHEDFDMGREAQTCAGSTAASAPSFCRQPGPKTLDCGLRHCGWGGECPTALSVTIPGGNEGLVAGGGRPETAPSEKQWVPSEKDEATPDPSSLCMMGVVQGL